MASASPSAAAMVAQLEARARTANTPAELAFSIANDSFGLLGLRIDYLLGSDVGLLLELHVVLKILLLEKLRKTFIFQ